MTNQQAFDIAVARLRDGSGQAAISTSRKSSVCCYRTPDGRRCAIGALIPDEQYKPMFDAPANGTAASDVASLVPALEGLNRELLDAIQGVHDSPLSWDGNALTDSGERGLAEVAASFGLTYTAQEVVQ